MDLKEYEEEMDFALKHTAMCLNCLSPNYIDKPKTVLCGWCKEYFEGKPVRK